MKTYKSPLVLIVLFFSLQIYAQVGIGTTDPEVTSILDMTSTTQGMLTPRMTTTQRTAISTTVSSKGLLVFDTTENAFYYYDGGNWVELSAGSSTNDFTGWASYTDGTHIDYASGQNVGTTKITLPNNANNIVESQKPLDIAEFYNSANSTITGRNGDGLNIVIEFKATPTTNQVTRLTVAIDIGGSIGELYIRDFVLSKGQGVEHYYLSSFDSYTLNTWALNGGTVKIVSTANARIYDIRYVLTRTHKAR